MQSQSPKFQQVGLVPLARFAGLSVSGGEHEEDEDTGDAADEDSVPNASSTWMICKDEASGVGTACAQGDTHTQKKRKNKETPA